MGCPMERFDRDFSRTHASRFAPPLWSETHSGLPEQMRLAWVDREHCCSRRRNAESPALRVSPHAVGARPPERFRSRSGGSAIRWTALVVFDKRFHHPAPFNFTGRRSMMNPPPRHHLRGAAEVTKRTPAARPACGDEWQSSRAARTAGDDCLFVNKFTSRIVKERADSRWKRRKMAKNKTKNPESFDLRVPGAVLTEAAALCASALPLGTRLPTIKLITIGLLSTQKRFKQDANGHRRQRRGYPDMCHVRGHRKAAPENWGKRVSFFRMPNISRTRQEIFEKSFTKVCQPHDNRGCRAGAVLNQTRVSGGTCRPCRSPSSRRSRSRYGPSPNISPSCRPDRPRASPRRRR